MCSNRTRDLDELIDDPNGFEALVNDNDWKILGADELSEEALAQKKHTDWMKKIAKASQEEKKPKKKKKKSKEEKRADKEKMRIEREQKMADRAQRIKDAG